QKSLQTENQSPHFLMEEKEFEDKLNTVLKMIPNGQREVFLMSRIDGLKYEEISLRLGLSIKAVEKRISKAMMIIKEHLGIKI
ncbi:MAG: sigma-70 family RNA polymerase sigma factor, partial [Bacteroidota bacterium]